MNEQLDKFVIPEGFKIVSGGQTGADQAGLDWAIAHNVPHGGWCPKGRKSEDGVIDPRYQLVETPTSGYLQRTEWNVRDSNVTLIFTLTEKLDGGSKKTAEFADKMGKKWRHFHPGVNPKYIATFLNLSKAKIVNIAGKRESQAPGITKLVAEMLDKAIQV